MENITMKKQYLFCCTLLLSALYTQYTRTSYYNDPVSHAAQVEQCAICLENMTYGRLFNQRARLQCDHKFHQACIRTNLAHGNNACPLCRRPIMFAADYPDPGEQAMAQQEIGNFVNQAKEHPYILVGTALVATGALAYKFRKPLAKLVAQAKAKAHNAYRKLLTLRIFKAQKSTAEAQASTR